MKYLIYTLCINLILTIFCFGQFIFKDSSSEIFPQGVASGDPFKESVVIWTRVAPDVSAEKLGITWEISTDSLFREDQIQIGTAFAQKSNNYCVKVIPDLLKPGTTYYFRFKFKDTYSPIGRTKTLPQKADKVRLAFVNCSKYEGGFFNGFNALTKPEFNDVDAVIHLGDYIYENPAMFPKSYIPAVKATGRKHKPKHEIISLQDYRTRFQQYREDSDLQALHQKFPMINIWDDHETANDSWTDGAKGHQPEEGSWETRKNNALKAYFEWIPIRGEQNQPIYRDFQFGNLVNLMMLDTRLCCRSELANSKEDLMQKNTSATIIGEQQMDWLFEKVQNTNAVWNVLGNQVLISKIFLDDGTARPDYDQWNGYPREREILKSFIKEQKDENFMVMTGNLHNARHFVWLSDESELSGDTLTHEFVPGSISSGGFAEKGDMTTYESAKTKLAKNNPHLLWFDMLKHGFIVAEYTAEKVTIDWYFVSTLLDQDYTLQKVRTYTIRAKK